MFRLPNTILHLTLAAALLSILLSSLLAYLFTVQDYRQLHQIIDLFDMAEKGDFQPLTNKQTSTVAGSVTNNAYFHIINNVINLFMSQTYLKLQLDAKKYALATAQLSALQYQINPHFLFNTLQSIDLEILKIDKRPTPANQMITELSQLLRYSLDEPMKYVSVGEEITMTKYYIDLQSHKYGSNIGITWEYTEEVLNLPMLRLMLQPLIENSLTHSGKVPPEKLWIKIKIYQKANQLTFTVIDNGHGLSKDRLREIRQALTAEEVDSSGKHIGLANISQRVRLAYDLGSMEINSKTGWGTLVQFSITC